MPNSGLIFRLQKVLDYRKEKEKQAQKYLSKALTEAVAEEFRLSSLEEELNNICKSVEKERNDVINLQEAINRSLYVEYLDECIDEQKKRVLEKKKEIEDRRMEVLEKTKKRKILSTLKENQHNVFVRNLELKEQKMTDEFGLYSFYRNNKQNEHKNNF